jgi:hypothetical protein
MAPPFLTSVLDGGEWSASWPGRFNSVEIAPDIRWLGGWMSLRVCLEAVENRKILFLLGIEPRLSNP